MATIPIRELSHHTARSLARVKAGEPVEITERGKVIARIVPVDASTDTRAGLVAKRRLRPGGGSRPGMLAGVRRRLAANAVDTENRASDALDRLRDDERY